VLPRVVETSNGILTWSAIERSIRPKVYYRAQTALVALENSHNMAGGTIYDRDRVEEIVERAHERGLRVHVDGARIFNAAAALGLGVGQLTAGCDSVQFCLSKGLGAPVGSLIVGDRPFIDRCRPLRKMLGGGMRQAGVLAAAGLVALEDGPDALIQDHANARSLADRLAGISRIDIDPDSVRTNIVIFGMEALGIDSEVFLERLGKRGVRAVPVDPGHVRMVTHRDVSAVEVSRAGDVVEEVVGEFEHQGKGLGR